MPKSLQTFFARLISLIKKPQYIGLHLVPDNFMSVKLYIFFSIIINYRIFNKRKRSEVTETKIRLYR